DRREQLRSRRCELDQRRSLVVGIRDRARPAALDYTIDRALHRLARDRTDARELRHRTRAQLVELDQQAPLGPGAVEVAEHRLGDPAQLEERGADLLDQLG